MPLPIKFGDQLLKRVGHTAHSMRGRAGREWGILMGGTEGTGVKREGEMRQRNHQLKAYSTRYSKRKSDDKGLQINIAHAVFPSQSEMCEVGPLRPMGGVVIRTDVRRVRPTRTVGRRKKRNKGRATERR